MMYMNLIHVLIIICICPLPTYHWFKEELYFLEAKFIIICLPILLFNDPNLFKSALKTYLIENTFYSLEEYYNLCS